MRNYVSVPQGGTRLAGAVAAALFALLTVAAPAVAGTVDAGADYSYVSGDNTQPTICDQEADGNTAYAKGSSIAGNSFRVNDLDGSSGSCWYETWESGVSWHQTCEDRNNAFDHCGDTSYH